MTLTDHVTFNVYSSPFTGKQMFVVDGCDPCQGGRKRTPTGAVSADMQSSYWGRMRYRVNVRLKVSTADWYIHNFFKDVASRVAA